MKRGYCRLCWCQAGAEAKAAKAPGRVKSPAAAAYLATLKHHQLFFASMKLRRPRSTWVRRYDRPGGPRKPPPAPAGRPNPGWVQLRLFAPLRRDFTRVVEREHPDPANPWLVWACYLAYQLGEAHGWPRGVRYGVQRALSILLADHVEGDTIRYLEMFGAMRPLELSVERTAEVLAEMGIFVDDRPPSFEGWLERKLDGLTPGIRRDVEAWARTLHDGDPRTRARDPATVWNHLNVTRPALLDWSARHDHLREVTRDDILSHLAALHGSARTNALVALRSLFACCRKHGMVFRDPARRIKAGERPQNLVQPLPPGEVDQAVTHAKTPAARLILALAAVHAARVGAIRALRLEDVDLGDRRLVIAGRVRPLGDLTHRVLLAWLDYRRARWPNTPNPHLLVNTKTALETGQVSGRWVNKMLRGLPVTFERLRVDRILEEALAHGRPDPLHLAAVFGLDDKTAIRYATAARELLESTAERYAAEGSTGTQGSTSTAGPNEPLGSQ